MSRRPGGFGALREFAQDFGEAAGVVPGTATFTAAAARVPAAVTDQLLVAIWNVAAEQIQPLGAPGMSWKLRFRPACVSSGSSSSDIRGMDGTIGAAPG
jgi:hypothetical protein